MIFLLGIMRLMVDERSFGVHRHWITQRSTSFAILNSLLIMVDLMGYNRNTLCTFLHLFTPFNNVFYNNINNNTIIKKCPFSCILNWIYIGIIPFAIIKPYNKINKSNTFYFILMVKIYARGMHIFRLYMDHNLWLHCG